MEQNSNLWYTTIDCIVARGVIMGFWVFMLIMNLLIPTTMIWYGTHWVKNAPKEMNSLSGYRTTMSMKNRDTWDFAHHYCGRLLYKWGLRLIPITLISMICIIGKNTDTVGSVGGIVCLVQMLPLVGVIIPTERALHNNFDKYGNRR